MPGFTEEDRRAAIAMLSYRLGPAQLRSLIPAELERVVANVEARGKLYRPRIADAELATFLVDLHGPELLRTKEVRRLLVRRCTDDELAALHAYDVDARPPRGRGAAEEQVVTRPWHAGKHWARHFVRVLGLPVALAGSPDGGEPPAVEDIEAYVPLPPLHQFQVDLLDNVLDVLKGTSGQNRAILSLPTGAGKTRTAVEAVIRGYREGLIGGLVLWIAQSDELCEQAFEAFREVWVDQSVRATLADPRLRLSPLRLFRLWSNRKARDPSEQGIIVASIQKLDSLCRRMESGSPEFLDAVQTAIVDEAHHAIAPSYTGVLRALGLTARKDSGRRSVLGLTATPYRGNTAETEQLIRRFHGRLIAPPWENPITRLREDGVLATMAVRSVATERVFNLTDHERAYTEQFHDLPDSALRRIGEDRDRNRVILQQMLEFPADWPVLFFGCSVTHARAVALLLRRGGRSAAVVTAETPRSLRRGWIEDFREGSLQYLCNYHVLTTGFDAPKIRAIVIAQPTGSVLRYEQMVGRGMRGPLNGGKEECLVVDMVDVIPHFGEMMSYQRYAALWASPLTGSPSARSGE